MMPNLGTCASASSFAFCAPGGGGGGAGWGGWVRRQQQSIALGCCPSPLAAQRSGAWRPPSPPPSHSSSP